MFYFYIDYLSNFQVYQNLISTWVIFPSHSIFFPTCLSSSKITSHFSKFIPLYNYLFITSCAVLFNYPYHLLTILRFTLAPIAYSLHIVQSPPTSHHFCILCSLLQIAITLAYYATKHHFAEPLQHLIITSLDLLPILRFPLTPSTSSSQLVQCLGSHHFLQPPSSPFQIYSHSNHQVII